MKYETNISSSIHVCSEPVGATEITINIGRIVHNIVNIGVLTNDVMKHVHAEQWPIGLSCEWLFHYLILENYFLSFS